MYLLSLIPANASPLPLVASSRLWPASMLSSNDTGDGLEGPDGGTRQQSRMIMASKRKGFGFSGSMLRLPISFLDICLAESAWPY